MNDNHFMYKYHTVDICLSMCYLIVVIMICCINRTWCFPVRFSIPVRQSCCSTDSFSYPEVWENYGFYRWSSWDETVVSNLDSTEIDKNMDIIGIVVGERGPQNNCKWLKFTNQVILFLFYKNQSQYNSKSEKPFVKTKWFLIVTGPGQTREWFQRRACNTHCAQASSLVRRPWSKLMAMSCVCVIGTSRWYKFGLNYS